MKDDTLLNFAVNQEKRVDKVLRKLVESNSMTEKTRKSLKPLCSKPDVIYDSCEVHRASLDNRMLFQPILSTLNTPTYKLPKFLVAVSKPLTTNELTVKDSFHFAEEIVDQQPDFILIWVVRT